MPTILNGDIDEASERMFLETGRKFIVAHTKRYAAALGVSPRALRRTLVEADLLTMTRMLSLVVLEHGVGDTGSFVHWGRQGRRKRFNPDPCWFCSYASWNAFLTGNDETQGDDVFECALCGVTLTRRDRIGVDDWAQMEADRRERQAYAGD